MIAPEQFLDLVAATQPAGPDLVKLGTIATPYSGGRPKIVFDGEATATVATYPYSARYTPVAGDRVWLLRAGNTYIVVDKII
jgi:hypothetical protein